MRAGDCCGLSVVYVVTMVLWCNPCYGGGGIRLLNARADAVSIGTIYLVTGESIESVVALLSARSLNSEGGWLREAAPAYQETKVFGYTEVSHCGCRLRKPVYLGLPEVKGEYLADPQECLEIVNRPITGLIYNRNAEGRIMQWRAAVASAILSASRKSGTYVALCTGVEKGERASLIFDGDVTLHDANNNAIEWVAGTALSVDVKKQVRSRNNMRYVPIDGRLLIRAVFRKVSLVESSTYPRIEFKYDASLTLSVLSSVEAGKKRRFYQ